MLKRQHIPFVMIFMLAISLAACSDNGTAPDHGQPPKIPDLNQAFSVDLGYFQNTSSSANQSKTASAINSNTGRTNSNFNNRQTFVETIKGLLNSSDEYSDFLSNARSHSAEFKNGKWIWTYNYNYNGSSASLKLTANENKGPEMNSWALYISYSNGNTQVNDYKFMEGTVSKDGSTGHWEINAFGSQSNYKFTADWTQKTNSNKELTVAFYQNENKEEVIKYSAEPPVYKLTSQFLNSNDIYVLHWNTDTKKGYWKDNGRKKCWDKNFQSIPCG